MELMVLLTAILFYFIGRYSMVKDDEVVERVKSAIYKNDELGIIKRPTAKELKKRDTIEEQGDVAMEKTLDNIL